MAGEVIKIAPSLLAADFARFGEEAEAAEAAGADYLHLDVMDGSFVPNITFGHGVVAAVHRACALPLVAHLMVVEPERHVEEFARAGAHTIIVHAETTTHLYRLACRIRETGCRAGVALCPAIPLEMVRHVLGVIDWLLVMTVEPGFGGQPYLPAMTAKIAEARRLLDDIGSGAALAVDGGINQQTAPEAVAAGARVLVAGSALFGHSGGLAAGLAELRAAAATSKYDDPRK